MNGFLVIDKPEGFTSFDVVAVVRRALNVKKVGHLGTLDPMATGVLVLAIGEGTKLIEYMMGADKIYEAQFEFGKVSKAIKIFYRYAARGWNAADAMDCAECEYVEWIVKSRNQWPNPIPMEPDMAAAARAVACLKLIKG